MLGKMAKVAAYRNAPKTTSALFNPRASARLAHTKYDLRHGYAPRITAIGAALIAMPIGFLIGKLLSDRGKTSPAPEVTRDPYSRPM